MYLIIIILMISSLASAQDSELAEFEKSLQENDTTPATLKDTQDAKAINLRSVIEEGLRRNALEKVRVYERERVELQWQDDFEKFWLPNLSLNLTTANQQVDRFFTDTSVGPGTSTTPQGELSLRFEEYSVFNWGRDYLEYINNKTVYQRSKEQLNERRRQLRFQLISQYFNVVKTKEIYKARRDQLRHSSFVHRLAQEKVGLGKITKQEFFQTKANFLDAQAYYQQAGLDVVEQEEILATLIGDNQNTTYKPEEILQFKEISSSEAESLKMALTQSPEYRDAITKLENTERSYQKRLKDNMPLPKFSVNLGAHSRTFGENGVDDTFRTGEDNKNIELVASVNMKWNIIGEGGLFNSREVKREYLEKRIAEIQFTESKRKLDIQVRNLYRKVRFFEKKIQALSFKLESIKTSFDATLDNYIAGKTTFLNIKDAMLDFAETTAEFQQAKYDHLNLKLQLADLMGVEDFPGDNFEKLVTK